MTDVYDGADLVTAEGDKIGTVERTYEDDAGTVRFVEVSTGTVFSEEHRLVPVDGAEMTAEGLRVPYSKQMIDNSPDASSAGDTLQGSLLDQIRAYYEREQGNTTDNVKGEDPRIAAVPAGQGENQGTVEAPGETVSGSEAAGTVRDLGDVIEVPVIEEELVRRPVVKEVLRIRKTQVTEPQMIGADMRKEEVDVVQGGEALVHGDEESRP